MSLLHSPFLRPLSSSFLFSLPLYHQNYFSTSSSPPLKMSPSSHFLVEAYQLHSSLSRIKPTGPKGHYLKHDILSFLKENPNIKIVKKSSESPKPIPSTPQQTSQKSTSKPDNSSSTLKQVPSIQNGDLFSDITLSNMRKVIAERLTQSKTTIPHAYLSIDINIHSLVEHRKQINNTLSPESKLSVTDFIIKAVALALNQVPQVNIYNSSALLNPSQNNPNTSSVDVSVAVATSNGLVTPVIKNAALKNLKEVSSSFKDLAERARNNKLKPEDYIGGSFTISNLGMFGIEHFTAVINPPQGAILAVSAPEKRLVISEDYETNPNIRTEEFFNVTLSFDQRVIPETTAAEFLNVLSSYFATPQLLR